MRPVVLKTLMNLWPPFIGAGIRVEHISDDYRQVRVGLKLRWYNRNYVKTHFGGSLFAMTDPFYMLMIMQLLGKDYYVWDKAASIDFIAPGRGKVMAHFHVTDELLEDIRQKTASGEKYLPELMVRVVNEQQEPVAMVKKVLYVKKKDGR